MNAVRFGILGPLEVSGGAPAAAKLRGVLGTLLVRANEVVSVDALIDELWPDSPPRTAATTLQVYVSHLRKALRTAGPHHDRETLLTRRPGYLARVTPDELDSTAFIGLARRGHQALNDGDFAAAADLQRRALALWRGPLLSDIPHGPLLEGAAVRMDEARTTALDERVRAELHLGMHRELVPELHELAAEFPLREEFHAHLMVALYRCGRQAEALRVFTRLRHTLVDELGIEPGPRSRRLQQLILAGDPALARPEPGPRPVAVGAAGGDTALPGPDPSFVGRTEELASLEALLRGAKAGDVVAVTGMPGAGKTALAVEAAHRAADAFPGGLRLLDPRDGGPPPRPAPAPGTLLVVDGVASEAEVRPLLPLGYTLLLTARRVPAGLPGLRTVLLGPWRPEEARQLVPLLDGPDGRRVSVEQAEAVAERCGWLPLAVRAAAAQLAARPHWTPATLVDRLYAEESRLDALRTGDMDVRARLLVAYEDCDEVRRRQFRLLSLLPPGPFDAARAAAALGLTGARALAALEELADDRLVEADRDAWRLPELLRLVAAERLAAEEDPATVRAAVRRVCLAYLPGAAGPRRATAPDAPALARLAGTAYDAGLWELTVRLTDGLAGFARPDAVAEEASYALALDAARRCADRPAQARMLRLLAELAWRYRRFERARDLLGRALELARECGDEEETGQALVGLAELLLDGGAADEAADLLGPALAAPAHTRARYEATRARALVALAQEGPEAARTWFTECLTLAGALDDPGLRMYARRSLRALDADADAPGAGFGAVEIRPGLWRIHQGGPFARSSTACGEPCR
ncbi:MULTISPECIES: BTAD domain-containing putative transcriptional regulator [unclassified Streptomyces]|uniref:AfsR/SARP family transcriptional regulator n=1 Tax=unclassified Streptomyces TaxID=2593676 RepID=UPI002ED2C0B9|nr:winged helix-turn-helix domain-containing protein [Streptomyces sp. NBC_00891]WSY06642.1 winged helix-turn-helix domain-containing protein [Streptomyces sp. NBC_00890]WSZ08266.1 winged helix-turn-helix domain-containing protein [Streptomyces sp. NBC_00869]WSZ24235.1 winged helix-turn-helix domain-containing protein [Streptomyces sp. NBC_00870]